MFIAKYRGIKQITMAHGHFFLLACVIYSNEKANDYEAFFQIRISPIGQKITHTGERE